MNNKKIDKKGFYIALLLGVVSLFAITYTVKGIRQVSDKLASINKAKNSLEISEDMEISNEISSNYKIKKEEIRGEEKKNNSSKEVISTKNKVEKKDKITEELRFDEEKGLSWPIEGKIVKEFSMDKLVYFPTVGSFKVNPAVFISAKKGASVKSAYKGIITNIGENKEIGKFVEMEIGNDYKLLYGQLKDIIVKVGDRISENTVIGEVGAPTAYYAKEGVHLYFKVSQLDKVVNPMILLR